MRKIAKDFSYTLKTNGHHTADMLIQVNPCCDIMSEWVRREYFQVEEGNTKLPDISFNTQEIYGIKYCPWCGASIKRIYK